MAPRTIDPSRLGRLDCALREMFEAFSAQPVPGRLLSLVEQLDEGEGVSEPRRRRRTKRKQA